MLLRLVRNPLVLLLSIAFVFGSCSKDDELDRVKFIGTYGVVETCGSGNDTYDIVITASSTGDDKVVIANLYDLGGTITGTISGNTITIASQTAQTVTPIMAQAVSMELY
ncbi:MAG: hypothetical protein R2879_13670 [Saprospiraceae bacterium]